MMDINKKIYLYANCLPVKGAKNAIICDLHRGTIFEIDHIFYDIVTQHGEKTVREIIQFYGEVFFDEIVAYLEELMKLELILLVDSKEGLIDLPLEYDSSSIIENMILEYGDYFYEYSATFIEQLKELRTSHIEIRFYEDIEDEKLIHCLDLFHNTYVKGINILIQNKSLDVLRNLLRTYGRLAHICVFNATEKQISQANPDERISFLTQNIQDNSCCGVIQQGAFFPNIPNFTESLQFNSCLNRKMSISRNGEIKNCPSMKLSFGNIEKVDLVEVAKLKKFQKLWNVSKDLIKVCRDCEYRNVCIDCRAYTEDPEDIFSKPLKCGYNPYKGKWEKWSNNPMKEKAMKFYGFSTKENVETKSLP